MSRVLRMGVDKTLGDANQPEDSLVCMIEVGEPDHHVGGLRSRRLELAEFRFQHHRLTRNLVYRRFARIVGTCCLRGSRFCRSARFSLGVTTEVEWSV